MADCVGKPVGAIASDLSGLAEEAGYSDDSAAKPISKKKKTTRKRRHGESIDLVYRVSNPKSESKQNEFMSE